MSKHKDNRKLHNTYGAEKSVTIRSGPTSLPVVVVRIWNGEIYTQKRLHRKVFIRAMAPSRGVVHLFRRKYEVYYNDTMGTWHTQDSITNSAEILALERANERFIQQQQGGRK